MLVAGSGNAPDSLAYEASMTLVHLPAIELVSRNGIETVVHLHCQWQQAFLSLSLGHCLVPHDGIAPP